VNLLFWSQLEKHIEALVKSVTLDGFLKSRGLARKTAAMNLNRGKYGRQKAGAKRTTRMSR